jgi:hypothetical protein
VRFQKLSHSLCLLLTESILQAMVDYSKWNKFCDSDEDEDDAPSSPFVQKIDEGRTIHIGPTGASIVPSAAPAPVRQQQEARSASKEENTEIFHASTHSWKQDRYEGDFDWCVVP